MTISVVGTSISDFGELWDKSLEDLLFESMDGAIADANLDPTAIEAIFVANKAGGNFNNQHHLNSLASSHYAHHPPAMRIEAACASGGLALLAAEDALRSGRYQTVLVVGVEKMTDVSANETTHILSGAAHAEDEYGSTFPGLYAIIANAHANVYGDNRALLSQIAVLNHDHAMTNPHAQFHKKISELDVERSQLVASPLRVFDCSPISDGSAAVVLTTKKTHAPQIIGVGHAQDTLSLHDRGSLTTFEATRKAGKQALMQAGIPIDRIQAAEVHDCFTIGEVLALEDLEFCHKGTVATFLREGKVVINPSGGLKACGHPVGATGVKQVAYVSKYLQENKLKFGLTHNVGGTGATAVVHILASSY
jgi:acetyl-CoA C-acetyltransferase